jgi:hypothetical protein
MQAFLLQSARRNQNETTLEMETVRSSETFVITYKTTRCHNPEDQNRQIHLCDNLKSQKMKQNSHNRTCIMRFGKQT